MRRPKRLVLLMSTLAFLSAVMSTHGGDKQDASTADRIVWGKVVNGLQLGIFPDAGADGLPATLFDGKTLHVNIQVRNASRSPVRFLPSTFACAAVGSGGAIPVTKLVLTPSKAGEPLLVTYQGVNHLSDKRALDADDLEYYTTELEPGQSLKFSYPVTFTPGEERATSWQRTGKSNLVPAGRYQLKAVFAVDRQDSPWKGELSSGSLDIEFRQ